MTTRELVEYFRRKAEARAARSGKVAQPEPDALMLKEQPPKYGGK